MDTSSVKIMDSISEGEIMTLTAIVEGKTHCVFTDDICEKRTQMQTETVDLNPKLFSCVTCNKQLRSKQNSKTPMNINDGLKTHMKRHDGLKTHIKRHDGLKTHTKRHDGLKPNICDICDKSFMGMQRRLEKAHANTQWRKTLQLRYLVLQVIFLII